jgi:hypothetical protein
MACAAQSRLVNTSTKAATKRRRVTALLSPQQFERLERLASASDQPVSKVAAMILGFVLDQDAEFTTNKDHSRSD